jgi:mono/diheme cytochrome c family protein
MSTCRSLCGGALAALATTVAFAQGGPFAKPAPLPYANGEQVYRAICQGCHMADGKGAQGAGTYPALAENPRLATAPYPALVVLDGKHGMPPFRGYLDDAQVAAVVNFVRTNFGNRYTDVLSANDVNKLRGNR